MSLENKGPYEELLRIPFRQIIYRGEVTDTDDPYNLGRVRVNAENKLKTNYEGAVPDWNENTDKWTDKDPFIFLPLLPYFIYQVPKVGEYVHIIYTNPGIDTLRGQYYVQGPFSSPTTIFLEDIDSSKTLIDAGIRNKRYDTLSKNGEVNNPDIEGIYPKVDDIALMGRNNSDVILKNGEVLIRAGKHNSVIQNKTLPVPRLSRAFLQLSQYNTEERYGQVQTRYTINEENPNIKKLIEYEIFNPETQFNAFTGQIILYSIEPDELSGSTKAKNVTNLSDIESFKRIQYIKQFSAIGLLEVVGLVNTFINDVMKGKMENGMVINNQFPLYYRPNIQNSETSNNFSSGSTEWEYTNLNTLFTFIKPTEFTSNISGGGLIYDRTGKSSLPKKILKEKFRDKKIIQQDNTVGIMGANQLYLISHNASNPAKESINLSNTLYGINQSTLVDEIQPKTSSVVRGEELMTLIELIIRYLTTHVHAYHGLPPVPVSSDGTRVDDLLKELLEASSKILNKNIRIN